MSTRADRVATGQDGGPARGALRFHVHVGETQAFACKPVDARRRRPPCRTAAIDAEFAVAEIVDQHEQDVRLQRRRRCLGLRKPHRRAAAKRGRRGKRSAAEQYAAAVERVTHAFTSASGSPQRDRRTCYVILSLTTATASASTIPFALRQRMGDFLPACLTLMTCS